MPNTIREIKAAMQKLALPKDVLAHFDFPETNDPETILALIGEMDKHLTKEQRLAVMERQGCCVTGKPAAAHRAFGKKHADKPIAERISLLHELDTVHNPPCKLNDDGTLSVYWGNEQDGAYKCVCGYLRKLEASVSISPTFCGCCGGHARQNLQRSLGVKLKLTEIVSSAASTGGEKRCEFLFDIISR